MRHPTNTVRTVQFGWVRGYPLNQDPNRPGYQPGYGYHMGTDYAYDSKDPYVYSPEDGKVTLVPQDGTLGNAVYLTAGDHYWAFGHLDSYAVTNNMYVKEGQPLGVMGQTGAADGKHCHAALKVQGKLVDAWELIEKDKIITMVIPDKDNYYARFSKLMSQIRGRDSFPRSEFQANFVGQPDFKMVEVLSDSKEAEAAVDYRKWGQMAKDDRWDLQIKQLQDENQRLKAATGEDSAQLNALGTLLQWFIVRLGLNKKDS